MGSICVNYVIGILISHTQKEPSKNLSTYVLSLGVVLNLLVLIYYKYIHFIIENLFLLGVDLNVDVSGVTLPIGVSFFTFQNISYLIDVYRKEVKSQKNLIHLGLYISLFPQLIAGPIVRYIDIFKEIKNRVVTKDIFSEGIIRFIRGLAKKVIIANSSGLIADKIFVIAPEDLSTPVAWLGAICYSLQIYFDFSGYSDMAIGLGKMLGFNFKENFNYPYISTSVQEFWRRWHISLSTWFRDYLYIPLGGNRKGKYRTYFNLLLVFFITGLWHGASWNFVVWGLYHGFFLLIERIAPYKTPQPLIPFKRLYLILVVVIGWVFFRVENLTVGLEYIVKMFSFSKGFDYSPLLYLNNYVYFVLLLGLLFSTPLRKILYIKLYKVVNNEKHRNYLVYGFYLALFIYTVIELAQATYNPFIYFRF
jgi:alginate O-acetyltransferase complex protein AlgI